MDHLAFLSRATGALLGSLDVEMTLRRMAEVAVPTLGDVCSCVASSSHGRIHRARYPDVDPRQDARLANSGSIGPLPHAEDHPIARALRAGEPVFVPVVTEAWRRRAATSLDQLGLAPALHPRSLIAVPLIAGDQMLGALTACHTVASGRGHAPDDLYLAAEFARRAA